MMLELLVFVIVAVALFFIFGKGTQEAGGRRRKDSDAEEEKSGSSSKTAQFYEKQEVHFVKQGKSYSDTLRAELEDEKPHFNTLRELAASDAKGKDFFGVKFGKDTWLFPVSQKYLKELYSMTNLDGRMDSMPFSQAVGYAPKGMPFMHSNEHWKELRKNLAAIFHSDFMDAYLHNFHTAMKDLVSKWKSDSGNSRNVKHDICDMAYDSALYSLTGAKLDVNVPYSGPKGTTEEHIRDVNTKTLNAFAKHAASDEFVENKNYRETSKSDEVKRLNQNMDTLGGALTGLVKARASELANGAESKKTIVDAAYGLLVAGVVKDVEEAVHHGWAILNGAHNNCGNALSAALYYLLQNPECYDKLKKEFDTEIFNEDVNESNFESVVTKEKLKDMEYLNLVVKETFRLSSPIYGKPMKAKEDIKLEGGFTVKKDTIVYPNNGVLGVSENIWKEPMKFIPERFDPESSYFKLPNGSKREPIAWLAFGAGPRACMGDNYSMYFVKVGLAYLLHFFEFELKEESPEEGFFYWLIDKNYIATVKNIA